jgi:hypothetical protein
MLATDTVRARWARSTAGAVARGVLEASAAPLPTRPVFDIDTRRERLTTVPRDAGFTIDPIDAKHVTVPGGLVV